MSAAAHATLIVGADSKGVSDAMQRSQAAIEAGVRNGIAAFKRLDRTAFQHKVSGFVTAQLNQFDAGRTDIQTQHRNWLATK